MNIQLPKAILKLMFVLFFSRFVVLFDMRILSFFLYLHICDISSKKNLRRLVAAHDIDIAVFGICQLDGLERTPSER